MATPPKGWGLYCTRRSYSRSLGDVSKAAERAREARVRNVILLVEGEDGYVAPFDKLKDVKQTYEELCSARVFFYSFPGDPDRAAEAGDRLADAVERLSAAGPVGDVELAFKGRPEAAEAFLRPLITLDPRRFSMGVTSYPIMRYHPTIPWEKMRWGWGNPQIYRTAADRGLARQALQAWREAHGGIVVPALAAFETSSPGVGVDQLRGDVERVLLDDHGKLDVGGAILWAEPSLDSAERQFMREWAERHGW